MMDVERMKRVNALARELMDHGMVSDYEEAYREAERMIDSGMNSSRLSDEEISVRKYSSPEEPPKISNTNVSNTSIGGYGMIGFDALEFRNMKERLDTMEQQMNMVFTKINEIISEINRLDSKRANSPIEIRDKKEIEEKQRELQTNLKKQEVEHTPHPRSGDYKPGDVSIEKMFYFGGGR